jgi:hypothetical protein
MSDKTRHSRIIADDRLRIVSRARFAQKSAALYGVEIR